MLPFCDYTIFFSESMPSYRHTASLASQHHPIPPSASSSDCDVSVPPGLPLGITSCLPSGLSAGLPSGLDMIRGVSSAPTGISSAAATVAALGLSSFYPGMLSPYSDLPLSQGLPNLCELLCVITL